MSQDIGKILVTPKSTWVSDTNYEILDAVTYQGKAYISKQSNNIGNTPSGQTDTYWFMFAKDGRSITGISKTGSATIDGRVVDTYTITYNEGNPTTFTVTNGKDGEGSGDMLKSTYDSDNSVANAGGIASYVSGAITGKADKVSGAINGNFASFDSNGNLTDSGKKPSDFCVFHLTFPFWGLIMEEKRRSVPHAHAARISANMHTAILHRVPD